MAEKIRCNTCPWCKDSYPGKLDHNGYHFHICGMTGNMVYTMPRKEKRYSGSGYIHFGISSCGLFDTADDVLAAMTEIERQRYSEFKWFEGVRLKHGQIIIEQNGGEENGKRKEGSD